MFDEEVAETGRDNEHKNDLNKKGRQGEQTWNDTDTCQGRRTSVGNTDSEKGGKELKRNTPECAGRV